MTSIAHVPPQTTVTATATGTPVTFGDRMIYGMAMGAAHTPGFMVGVLAGGAVSIPLIRVADGLQKTLPRTLAGIGVGLLMAGGAAAGILANHQIVRNQLEQARAPTTGGWRMYDE